MTSDRPVILSIWKSLLPSIAIGLGAYGVREFFIKTPIFDPLTVALLAGILLRFFLQRKAQSPAGLLKVARIAITIGVFFYALKNLNFVEIAKVEPKAFGVALFAVLGYFVTILGLGYLLKQKPQITYLVANGSAICGASAIAITSTAVDADSEDVSISLLAVMIVALMGLFNVIPLIASSVTISNKVLALLAGSVVQFTGFVKIAVASAGPLTTLVLSVEAATKYALAIKSVRYLGLLVSIPIFASRLRKKMSIPPALIIFVAGGILGSVLAFYRHSFYVSHVIPVATPLYSVLWCVALAALGFEADIQNLLSNRGIKAIGMAAAGFGGALVVFWISFLLLKPF